MCTPEMEDNLPKFWRHFQARLAVVRCWYLSMNEVTMDRRRDQVVLAAMSTRVCIEHVRGDENENSRRDAVVRW